jgi:DNA-binding SARP family transcriptional activator
VQLRLLGPLELEGAEGAIGLGGPKERALVAYLALHADRSVGVESLIDALWPEAPPRTAARTVQAYVSRVRKAVAGLEGWSLDSSPGGWRLTIPPGGLDVAEVAQRAADGRRAADDGDHMAAALAYADALHHWRGEPLAELGELAGARAERARLQELRLHLLEERIDAEIACGRGSAVVPELEALCLAHPLRERLWGLQMTALYRAGRQADALRTFEELRRTLRDDLGLDPNPSLVQLEQQILQQDPSLAPTPAMPPPRTVGSLPKLIERLRQSPFVGRRTELAKLAGAWRAVGEGAVEVVLLAGEPGIGKTTLAAEQAAAAASEGGVVLFGRCDEESLVAFQPMVEALSDHVATADPDVLRAQLGDQLADLALLVPELGRRFPEVAAVVPTGAEHERYRLFEAVPALFRAAGDARPVLLLLDDLHWADRPTLQLLQHLVRSSIPRGLLVIGTYRDTDLVRTHPLAETLGELRRANLGTRLLVRGLLQEDVVDLVGGDPDTDGARRAFADSLWRETEGNPLFLRESLRHLTETGVVERDPAGGWRPLRRIDQLGIPEGVREVIGRRLSRLTDATNTALRAGSVLGREVRIDVLERVTDLTADQLLDAFEEAAAAGVVEEVPGWPGRYAFSHALVRGALYDELSLTRRVRLHQRVGEALERLTSATPDGPHLAELAHHFAQAAVAGQADKAIEYGRRAARHSASLAAYEEGVRHLSVALEVAEDSGLPSVDRADLLLDIGDLHWAYAAAAPAREAFARASALVGETDPERNARAVLGHAGAHQRSVWVELALSQDRTLAMLRDGLERLAPEDSALRATLLACLGRELTRVPDTTAEQRALASEALAMARRVGDPATVASVLLDACLATYGPDSVRERADMAEEAATVAASLGNPQLEGYAALHRFHAHAEGGDLDGALVHLERATELLTPLRDPSAAYLLPTYAGGLALQEGRLADSQALTAAGFRRGHELGDPNAIIVMGGGSLGGYLYAGRGAELLDLVYQVHDLYPSLHLCALAIEAALLAELGRVAECRAVLARVDPHDLERDAFWTFSVQCLARACWRVGDAERADDLGALLAPYAGHFAGIATIGLGPLRIGVGLCAATAGRHDEAAAHLAEAAATARRNGWHAVTAEALLRRAAVLAARGGPQDADRARALVHEGRALAEALELPGLLHDADRVLGALDGTLPEPQVGKAQAGRGARARSHLTTRGRAAIAWWTRGDSDDELVRRFGSSKAQRVLFGAMAKAFQPTATHGFVGDIEVELRLPDDGLDTAAPDWWTLEIGPRTAAARPGRTETPAVTIRSTLPDFIRLCSGELTTARALVGNRILIDGDLVLAARIPLMFGLTGPEAATAVAAEP